MRLAEIAPRAAMHNCRNRTGCNTVLPGNRLQRFALSAKVSDIDHLRFDEFGVAVCGPALRTIPAPALAYHILGVAGGITHEQMGGIDARGIVATVQYIHSLWYRAMRQLIGRAVGRRVTAHRPVAPAILRALPFPALVGSTLANEIPKHVPNRLGGETQEEMRRIDAQAVAAAVSNLRASRRHTLRQFIGYMMGISGSAAKTKRAISDRDSASPLPTFIGRSLTNPSPKRRNVHTDSV